MNLFFVAFLFGVASATDTTMHSDSEISAESSKKQLRGRALGGGNGGGNSGLANHEVAPCLQNLPEHSSSAMAGCKPKQNTAAPLLPIGDSYTMAKAASYPLMDEVLKANDRYYQDTGDMKIKAGSTVDTYKLSYENLVKHTMFAKRSCGEMISGVMAVEGKGSLMNSASVPNFKSFSGLKMTMQKAMTHTSTAIYETNKSMTYHDGFIDATSFEACARNAIFHSDVIEAIRTNCPVIGGKDAEVEISKQTYSDLTAEVVQREIVKELEQSPNTKVSYDGIMHMAAGCASTGSTLFHNVYVNTPGCGPFN